MATEVVHSPTNTDTTTMVVKLEPEEVIDIPDSPEEQNNPVCEDDSTCELEHLRKLFVGGLSPNTTEEGLRAFYGKWGQVVDVMLMREPVSKRSRCFCFVTFTKSSGVNKAQENRPHIIDGKTVDAKRALPRPNLETREVKVSVKKLFVSGLNDTHDEECLYEYFSQFGKVMSAQILTDKTTGKRCGSAFIEFDDYDAVDKAVLQSHCIKHVVVDVKKSVYQDQKNQKGTNGNAVANLKTRYSKTRMHDKASNGPPPPTQSVKPFRRAPPPQNYNYWGKPPAQAMPPQYGGYGGYQRPPPPQMNGWGYPPTPNGGWNAGPPQPPAGPPVAAWQPQPNQWRPPPPGPPRAAAPPPNPYWNMPPAAPPVPPPPGAPHSMPPQQQQPPPNFGTGYQQNYGGGPAKHNMHSNRMNPYNVPPNIYGHFGQPRVGGYGGGYGNTGPGKPHPPGAVSPANNGPPGVVPHPLSNGKGGSAQNGNKYPR